MTQKWCGLCQRRHYVQAVETPATTERVSLGAVLPWALVIGLYYVFCALAWAFPNIAQAFGSIVFGGLLIAGISALAVRGWPRV